MTTQTQTAPDNIIVFDQVNKWYAKALRIWAAFRSLKSDLGLRPIYHRRQDRVEAHIFVAFLAYCLQITLKNKLAIHAPGLTPTAVLDKLAAIQMIDVRIPTCDGRSLILPRYTQPAKDLQLLLEKLQSPLPTQPPPRITTPVAFPADGARQIQPDLW